MTEPSEQTVLELDTDRMIATVGNGVGTMTFNSPARLNAISMEMWEAVPVILGAFEADDDVRAIVVTGAGDRAFVSGADISEFGEKRTSPEARAAYDDASADAGRAFSACTKPIIGRIKGYCIGGGLLTALRCDIRIAAEGSQFAIPAAKLGLGYGYQGVVGLIDVVGPAAAAEILFSARKLQADEALRIGLVNRVVRADELDEAVAELAGQIAANAPLTLRAAKSAIKTALKDEARRDTRAVDALVEACFQSDDYREGQQAFLEKRTPRFRGR